MQQKIVSIKGMHCKSCEIMVADKLEALPGVKKAKVKLSSKSALLTVTHFPSEQEIASAVEAAGYEVGYENTSRISRDSSVYRDIVIGLVVVTLLGIILWGSGITDVSRLTTSNASVSLTALIVGLTAGLSTCMALIGGLVLGISAQHARAFPSATPLQRFKPHIAFNTGRIVGFTLFGAIIGGIGSAFQLSGSVVGWLMIIIGIVMAILGLSLTELFPRLKNITLPSSVAKRLGIHKTSDREYSSRSAIIVGALTFFLPCGFTQAMQLTAVGSGSPVTGALIMGMFAIGTTPGLLGVGGLTSIVTGSFAKTFFRIVGVGVIAMALINISNGANLANLRMPDFKAEQAITTMSGDTKKLETTFRLMPDIQPSKFTTKVGQKTALIVDVQEDGQGCMSTIMIPGLDDKPQFLQAGKKIILSFTPTTAGEYKITCAMGIQRGTLTVEE